MATLNIMNIRNELCDFLRKSDILSTTIRGVTRTTSNYSVGVGGESTHDFSAYIPVRNFKSLTVDTVQKYYLRDYTINLTTGILTWNSALTVGQAVAFQIDHGGSGDKIYPDMPRENMSLSEFPRIGIEFTSGNTQAFGIGGTNHISDILFTILVWVPVNKEPAANNIGGVEDLEEYIRLIRDAIRTNAKSFYTFTWIEPRGRGPIIKSINGKIMQMSSDFMIRWSVE